MPSHPLLTVLDAAAAGTFPPVDGVVETMPPDDRRTCAIVELTGHAYVLTDLGADDPRLAGADGFGGAAHPSVVLAVAGPDRTIGSHDAVLVRRGGSTVPPLPATDLHDDHPRAVRARRHRSEVVVLGDERGLVTIGRGLAGRTELSVEVVGAAHGGGVGRHLIEGGLAAVDPDRWVYAQVAPGNAASLRAFLACGFRPIGSEILIMASDHG